ncbi:hypothetical protein SCLARK_00664 [Spiroplasma clarkii]|uniref:hypothetical protein n=1 Tax=Spiroplasma clarkii TaxID=2139 RepID=UPI000B555249|nr:hypothetical protein [Spiroplasma clarkii]ARU91327.1 hypothetical protein SCLARK_00664 [Spiroplasma clarkii]
MIDYAYSNSDVKKYSYDSSSYLFEDQIYNSKDQLNNHILNKFAIKEQKTIKNPKDYVVDYSGKLGNGVLTDKTENLQKVYKGLSGDSYFDKNDAIDSYTNNYQTSYSIEGKEFENIYSAQNYYRDVKLAELEDVNYGKTTCYIKGSICETEDEIKSWIRRNVKPGFDYNGNHFSDYNYAEFQNAVQDLDQRIIDENIKEVANTDKNEYWIEHNNSTFLGFFVGPKYVQTREKLTELSWNPISSMNIDFISTFFMARSFIDVYSVYLETKLTNSNNEEYEFFNYIDDLRQSGIISQLTFKNFKSLSEKYFKEFIYAKSDKLNQIKNNELTNFHKFLITIKSVIEYSKIFPRADFELNEFENLAKKIVVEAMKSNKKLTDNLFKGIDGGIDFLLKENVKFDDIYNLHLNSQAFYENNTDLTSFLKTYENFTKVMDGIMTILGGVAASLNLVKAVKSGGQTSKESLNGEIKSAIETSEAIASRNSEIFMSELGIDYTSKLLNGKNRAAVIGIIAATISLLVAIWNISKVLSFISMDTYEAVIDENQSLFYITPNIRIPLIGQFFPKKDPNIKTTITPLVDSVLSYSSNNMQGKVWEFNNAYYFEKQRAIERLKNEIYLNPEKYIRTSKLYASIFDDSDYILGLPRISTSANDGGISKAQYEKLIIEEKEKYINILFEKYYEKNKASYYLDGFGNYFDTRLAAQKV